MAIRSPYEAALRKGVTTALLHFTHTHSYEHQLDQEILVSRDTAVTPSLTAVQ